MDILNLWIEVYREEKLGNGELFNVSMIEGFLPPIYLSLPPSLLVWCVT